MKVKLLLIYLFFAHLLLIVANTPLFLRSYYTPDTHISTLGNLDIGSGNYVDYNQYLSAITQGKNGYWLYYDAYTSEPTSPGYFFSFYILLGKIAAIGNVWPPVMYHISRIIIIEFFFFALYRFCRIFLPLLGAIIAAIIALYGSALPLSFFFPEVSNEYIQLWHSFSASARIDRPPHYILGQSLLLLSLYRLTIYLARKKIYQLVPAMLLTFLGGLVFTPGSLLIVAMVPITTLYFTVRKLIKYRYVEKDGAIWIITILLSGIALFTLLVAKLQTSLGHPWSMWSIWEVKQWNSNPKFTESFFFLFGILPIVAIPAIKQILIHEKWERIFLVLWVLFPFFFLPLATLLGFGKIRLLEVVPFVPLALLCTMTLCTYGVVFHSSFFKICVAFVLILTSVLSLTISTWTRMSYIRNELFYPITNTAGYISKSLDEAIQYMESTVPKGSVIFSSPKIGNVLPAFVPVKSYIGHIVLTKDYVEKDRMQSRFFSETMTEKEAKKIMSDNDIFLIYSDKILYYPFLKPVYNQDGIVLYEIKK